MKRARIERNIAVGLFLLVLITFSLAQRDSKKLEKIYSTADTASKSDIAEQPHLTQLTHSH